MSKANYSKAVPVHRSDENSNLSGAGNSKNQIVIRSDHYARKLIQMMLVLAAVVGCSFLVSTSSEPLQSELFKALSIGLGLCVLAIISSDQNR